MAPHVIAGDVFPDFRLKDLQGREHTLAEWRGRVVLINFWSAECDWSLRVDGLMAPMLARWGERVVYTPVASNANESPAQMLAAAQARGLETLLWDDRSALADRVGAEITPQFFILDGEGKICYHGAFDDINFRQRTPTRCFVEEVVDALLAGRQPETDHAAPFGCTIVRFSNLVA